MTRTRRNTLAWVRGSLCFCLVLGAQVAQAQATTTDSKAAAEALFDEGLALMQKGDFVAGCVKLEQSQSIDHGIGTMLYLAECYEKSGRTASAWALFRQAASEAAAGGESERAEAGKRRAERLTPLLSKLTINVATPAPAGLEITRNGAPVPNALWGVATPVDPGDQRIDARAPGYAAWSGDVRVGDHADASSLTVPPLTPAAPTAVSPAAPTTSPSAALAAPAASEPAAPASTMTLGDSTASADDAGATQRTIGLVLGGAGIVAVGVGAVFGLQAMSKDSDADAHCGRTSCRDPKGAELSDDAQSAARLANIFVIGGAVLAAAGVVVYLVAPAHEQPMVALASNGRSIQATLGGAF